MCHMKDSGFTLIELLAVAVIMGLIALLAVPSILNQIQQTKDPIGKTTQELIFQASSLYVDANPDEYPKENGTLYCFNIGNLIDQGFLKSPFIDSQTNNEIPASQKIQARVQNHVFEFSLTDECKVQLP